MECSILGSEKTLNNVKCFVHSQPSSGIIRTAAKIFPLQNKQGAQKVNPMYKHFLLHLATSDSQGNFLH
jgi:hypothetical protein